MTDDLPPNALPDLDLGRRFILTCAVPGDVFQCGVTGSHDYGFSSPDSDLDLKGVFIAPTRSLLGLRRPNDAVERLTVFEGLECDLSLTEVGRALSLLLAGNGNMIERLLTPFQLYESPEIEELQALARGAVSRRFIRHYQGFFRGMCREHEREPAPRAKSLLYAYRVALTGVHLLRTGELEADLRRLAPLYGYDDALSLIRIKVEGAEKGAVSQEIDALHRAAWPRLEADLQAALEHSPLPDDPPNEVACEAWLVELRRRRL
ncbi:nucleotidyltransferase domain-containing protein [Nannocystis pusilla]|uniref:nucleotidyltransferase domain-containing protein n=1 Tax=Nannocystis pusilla TaxID=889268 RepID=UPI003BF3EEB2